MEQMDLEPLAGLRRLTRLGMLSNELTDLTPLAELLSTVAFRGRLMEVAGIEPASEDISIVAPTCVSQIFRFAYRSPCAGFLIDYLKRRFAAHPLRMDERLARIAMHEFP